MSKISLHFSSTPPCFSDLEIHGSTISTTWSGQSLTHPVHFLFWVDQTHFHFLAEVSGSSGLSHPESQASQYQAELWKYDVAEFFITAPDRSRYLEVNLAPNGAWWSCLFTQARQNAPGQPAPIPKIITKTAQKENSWQAMARIPLSWLQEQLDFGEQSSLNSTFILDSPQQIFLSAGNLGDGDPDFHRPDHFPRIKPISLT